MLEQTLNNAVSNQTPLSMIDTKTITDTDTFMKRQLVYLTQTTALLMTELKGLFIYTILHAVWHHDINYIVIVRNMHV